MGNKSKARWIIFLLIMILISGFMIYSYIDYQQNNKSKATDEQKEKESINKLIIKPEVSPMFVTLMFHEIAEDDIEGTNTISKRKLESILKYLSENQYRFLSAQEAYDFLTKKMPVPEKSIWLTFDDGLRNSHKIGTPLLRKYGARATAFVEIMQIDKPLRLSSGDLKSMTRSGLWDIQSHGYNGHNTSLTDIMGNKVNFYFNRLLIGDIYESEDDYKKRIKKDIEKSFDLLEKEYNSKRQFFAYPLDDETSEKSEEIKIIQSCLDELNVLGVGVKGNQSNVADWSTPKHKITRYGITNLSEMKGILSLLNTGKRIYLNESKLTNIAGYLNNQYISWDRKGNIVILNEKFIPKGDVIKITKKNGKKQWVIDGKMSFAVQSDGTVWVASWDKNKIFELAGDWNVKKEYNLDITPAAIWFNEDKLYIIDPTGCIYYLDENETRLQFKPNYKVGCSGGCVKDNIVYVSDYVFKNIYKIDYINKDILGVKKYDGEYIITPQIADGEDEFIANEASNDVLIRVKY